MQNVHDCFAAQRNPGPLRVLRVLENGFRLTPTHGWIGCTVPLGVWSYGVTAALRFWRHGFMYAYVCILSSGCVRTNAPTYSAEWKPETRKADLDEKRVTELSFNIQVMHGGQEEHKSCGIETICFDQSKILLAYTWSSLCSSNPLPSRKYRWQISITRTFVARLENLRTWYVSGCIDRRARTESLSRG